MLDNIIIISYLVLTLIIGFYKGRNIKSMQEFSVADKKYSLPILVATMTATVIGGGATLGLISSIFSVGVAYIFIAFGNPINRFLVSQFFVDRIDRFADCISVGDIMHRLYGRHAQIITGICGALYGAAAVGGQVSAIGFIVHYFLGLPIYVGALIGCGAVILYSSVGGIKAVTATDLLQFAVLIIAIPMVCNVGLNLVGGYEALFASIPVERLAIPESPTLLINYFFIFLAFCIPFLDPPHTQRLLMAKDVNQIKNTLRIASAIEIPFFIAIGLIGLIAIAVNPEHDANTAFPDLVNTIIPIGLRGVAVAGLLSVVMSTADSYLNACGINLVHDTIRPLWRSQMSDKTELRIAQLTTFILGTLAMVIALSFSTIMSIILFSLNFWGPIVVIPLYAGLLGYEASPRCFYVAITSGAVVFLIWHFMIEPHVGIGSLIPSMLANAIGFLLTYHYEKLRKLRVA